ncbi:acetyl-CoA carboxylase biotin carboxylase subunit family protein [Streptomyces sp. NPDC008001]|uniref:ATP-grasp domain-containing protein n=1 Tax=Streptomyces sp. NPDC008001 TaxID=3364804 RepID=UPI0036EEEABA
MHLAFVDSNPAALQAIRLAKEAGHRVTYLQSAHTQYPLTDANLALVSSVDRLVDGLVTTDHDVVTGALAECHAEHPIDFVTTQHEMSAEAVAVACRALGLRGTCPEAVLVARRKDRCRAALQAAGLASARFATAGDEAAALAAAERIGYPVVFKPPSGAAGMLARVVHDAGEARAAWYALQHGLDAVPEDWRGQFRRGVLIEEFLAGELVSMEFGVRGDRFFPLCISGRFRWAGDGVTALGSFIPADLDAQRATACWEYARQVCAAIGADVGVFHLELMVTPRGPVLVEFNPRVMGGGLPAAYRHATGQEIYTALLDILAGADDVPAPSFRAGCTAVRVVIPREGGRLAPGATLAPLAEHPSVKEVIGFGEYRTGPGSEVARGQALARFIVQGAGRAAVEQTSERLLSRLEPLLGVPLMTGSLMTGSLMNGNYGHGDLEGTGALR